MSDILSRFSLESLKFNNEILACLILVWLVVLGTTISSIIGQQFAFRRRLFWIVLVCILPAIGVLAYLPFSLSREDLPYIFQPRVARDKRRSNRPKRTT